MSTPGYGYPKPLSSTHGAPKYSFQKPQNGRVRTSKIHGDDVREFRRWVVREGYGLTVSEQAREMMRRYPGLGYSTATEIIGNRTWIDPSYDREQPHAEWGEIPTALLLLLMLRQMYSPVHSSLKVDVLEEPSAA